jgi:tetratricopeptide (TPR) repeat protein
MLLEPNNFRALEARSLSYSGMGRFADALADNDKLIAAEPGRVYHKVMRVLFLTNLKRPAEALQVADDIVKSDPQYAFGYFVRAHVLAAMDKAGDAMADLNLALERDPNILSALLLRAELNVKKANHDAVIEDTTKVLAKAPREIGALVLRGQSYLGKAMYDRAILDFQAVLAINSNHRDAQRGLETALARQATPQQTVTAPVPQPVPVIAPAAPPSTAPVPMKSTPSAPPPIVTPSSPSQVPTITQPAPGASPVKSVTPGTTITVDPKLSEAVQKLINAGQYKDALAAVDAALQQQANHAGLIHLRGQVFYEADRYDLAIGEYERALKIEPRFRQALIDRCAAAHFGGGYAKAVDFCNVAVSQYSDAYPAMNIRGLAKWRLGKVDDAIAEYDALTAAFPKYILGWYNRGRIHSVRKDMPKAIADFDQALVINPKHTWSLGERGLAHLAAKNVRAAEADFSAALELDGKNPPARTGMQALQATRAMEQLGQLRRGG